MQIANTITVPDPMWIKLQRRAANMGVAMEVFVTNILDEEMQRPRALVALKAAVENVVDTTFAHSYPADVIRRVFQLLPCEHPGRLEESYLAWDGPRRVHPYVASLVKERLDARIVGRARRLDRTICRIDSCSLLAPKVSSPPSTP